RGNAMYWQFNLYVLPVFASAFVCAWLALAAWKRRPTAGATSFCLLMLAITEWSLAYAIELMSPNLPTTLFWDNVTWFGSAAAPALWLAFTLQYTRRSKWLTRQTMAILAIEPFIIILLVWTNQFHGLITYAI